MKFFNLSAIVLFCAGTAAYAGDNNNVFVMQDSTGNLLAGNSLFIDQSDASNASVGGTLNGGLALQEPARQVGDGNIARLIQSGDASVIGLTQSGTGPNIGAGNEAEITVRTGGSAVLEQLGLGNSGILNADLGGSATLLQDGNGNVGAVSATSGARGTLEQLGDNNEYALEVTGVGTDVTFSQQTSNSSAALAGAAAQVFSNSGGTVIIQQRTIGGN